MDDENQSMNDSRMEAMVSEDPTSEPEMTEPASVDEREQSTVGYEDEEELMNAEVQLSNSVEEIRDVGTEVENTAVAPVAIDQTQETGGILLSGTGEDVFDESVEAELELGLSDTLQGLEELNFTTNHYGPASSVWEEEGSVLLDNLNRRTEPLTSTVEREVVEKQSLRQSRKNRGIPAPKHGEWTK